MTSSDSLSLEAHFARSVTLLASVTEPWPALSYLARTECARTSGPTSDPEVAETAISALNQTSGVLYSAALFSANDELDEIATRHIKYFLVPFLTAQALQSWQGEAAERLVKLRQAGEELQSFFLSMDRLELLSETERDCVLHCAPDAVRTPTQRREEKVARYRLEKAAARKLEALMNREGKVEDEEIERETALIVLQCAVRRALDLHGALEQEVEILAFGEKQRSKGRDPRAVAERARPRGPIPGMRGMPANFRIVSDREQEREGVFRPSHSLPTYTVEEWGEIEARMMMEKEREKQEKEVLAKRRKEEEDSDGDDVIDRETMEARRWDNWKDDHNKGSGNTIR